MGELKMVFRPEFLNRIDEVIVFHKLTRDEIKVIIDLMIGRVRAQVAEHELQLELDEAAKDLLVDKGWDPAMGARPLRRAIQRFIEDPLADEVLRTGDIVPGTTVLVERDPSAGDDDDRPLKMKLVKPKKRPAKKREPVGVGATSAEGEGSGPAGSGDDGGPTPPEDSTDEPADGAGADEPTTTE
jgi:ATP-dependent Clp protease ATP-binding subunit ClpC